MEIVNIGDKDGGIISELRPQIGAIPIYWPGTGDGQGRIYWQEQIHITGSGDNTIHSVVSGKRFFIDSIVLTVQNAGAALRLKSGASQNLSGILRLPANTPFSMQHGRDAELKGAYIGDNFVINTSGDNLTPYVGGWVTGFDEAV